MQIVNDASPPTRTEFHQSISRNLFLKNLAKNCTRFYFHVYQILSNSSDPILHLLLPFICLHYKLKNIRVDAFPQC